jgi:hypothetical protein
VSDVFASVSVVAAAVACALALAALAELRHTRRLLEAGDHALIALGAELVRLREALARIGRLAEEGAEPPIPPAVLGRIAADARAALRDGEGES